MAQEEKTIIRSQVEPKIVLDKLALDDVFKGTSKNLPENKKNVISGHQEQNSLGTEYPLVSINNYVLTPEELAHFLIDCTGFLPRVFIQFDMLKTAAFTTQSMPKDGDLINIFIRAKNDSFKPIRNDYVITSVDVGRGGPENSGSRVTINGELFIPHIRDEVVKSYKGNSIDVLKSICKDLKLGFATNETSTNDSQTWVCPSDSMYNFINYVVDHSWKSNKDFYKAYVDVYYHLNFVNMNNQFEGSGNLAAGLLDSTLFKDYFADDANKVQNKQVEVPKALTNLDNFQDTNFFIKNFQIVNNSSAISKKFGYKSYVQFFDLKSMKYWDLYVDPITSEGAEQKNIILKGRTFPKLAESTEKGAPSKEKFWKSQNKKEWLGVQSKNVHDNFLFSKVHNIRNRAELEKLFVEIDIQRWNPNIYNGEKIPIIMMNFNDQAKKSVDVTPETVQNMPSAETPTIDQFYTGYYVTDGMKFQYTRSAVKPGQDKSKGAGLPDFYQSITLRRREWPIP